MPIPEDRFGVFVVLNPDRHLKPGMFITAALYLPSSAAALTLPVSALFVEDGKSYAYVQADATNFERRAVDTVPAGAQLVRVVAGLAAGDRVATEGVLLLRQLDGDADNK